MRSSSLCQSVTKTERKTNSDVVSMSQRASFGGKRKINSSDCPRIWLIFELAVSPTPRTLRTFRRLCRSPQLLFLEWSKETGQHTRAKIDAIERTDRLPARDLHGGFMDAVVVKKSLERLLRSCVCLEWLAEENSGENVSSAMCVVTNKRGETNSIVGEYIWRHIEIVRISAERTKWHLSIFVNDKMEDKGKNRRETLDLIGRN